MTNERVIVIDAEAFSEDGRAVHLASGTRAVLLMAPLDTTEGDVAFVISGKRYHMPMTRFLEVTADVVDDDTVRPAFIPSEAKPPARYPVATSGRMVLFLKKFGLTPRLRTTPAAPAISMALSSLKRAARQVAGSQ